MDGDGWVITNGHVVQPAHETPRWLVNQQAQRAVITACLPKALERAGLVQGEKPEADDAIKRKLLDTVLPTAKVNLTPQVFVLISNGTRIKAEVRKYSPPVSTEPGRDVRAATWRFSRSPATPFRCCPSPTPRWPRSAIPIHIFGFPGVVSPHELLNKSASREASVTNGAVSGFKEDGSGTPVIQTDASAAWGNSGGPAVDDRGAMVGVLTFVSLAPGPEGSIVQGFNFIIPSQAVRDFVAGTPVKVGEIGRFDPVWFAGLRAFFTDDWKGAVQRFEEADRLLPNLPDVKRMLAEAREKVKNPPPRPFPWFWVAIGVTLLSLAGYGTQFYIRWQRNRYRVTPSEVIHLQEDGKQPTILDVRQRRGVRGPAAQDSGLGAPGPRGARHRHQRARARHHAPRRRVLHDARRRDERQGRAEAEEDGLQGRAHPEGRARRVDQCRPAHRKPLRSVPGRRRALQGARRRGSE